MSLRLVAGDGAHEAAARQSGDDIEVTMDGEMRKIRLAEIAPGAFLMQDGGQRIFYCVRTGEAVYLFWDGLAYRLAVEREGARTRPEAPAGALEAPMSGKVIAVSAGPGQAVKKGDDLVVVEAMKMEHVLRAPREGTVKSIRARVGEMVGPGQILVELE